MPSGLRYAVIGPGALGGYYGGLLARAGHEVHFLARSDHAHLLEHGLQVRSPRGDFHVRPAGVFQRAHELPTCDVVCICLKATRNPQLADVLPRVVRGSATVLLLQNGLGAEPDVAALLPAGARLFGGLAFLCSNKTGPGEIHHLDYGQLTLARYAEGYAPISPGPEVLPVIEDLREAGIHTRLSDDLLEARWKKLAWNIPFNGLSVVYDASTAELLRDPESRAEAWELMQEVRTAAGACGRSLTPVFLNELMANTERMAPYKTSMKLDAEEKRPMELEAMFAAPLRMAGKAGASLPRIRRLYRQLLEIDRRNASANSEG